MSAALANDRIQLTWSERSDRTVTRHTRDGDRALIDEACAANGELCPRSNSQKLSSFPLFFWPSSVGREILLLNTLEGIHGNPRIGHDLLGIIPDFSLSAPRQLLPRQ